MGIVLVYRSSRVINFAVGELGVPATALFAIMAGKHGWPYWPALIGALIVGTLTGHGRRARGHPPAVQGAPRDRARRDDRRRAALRGGDPRASRLPHRALQTQFPLPFSGEWHPGLDIDVEREPAARAHRRADHHARAVVAARAHTVRRRGARVGDQRRPRAPHRHQPEARVHRGLDDRRVPVGGRGDPLRDATRARPSSSHIGPETLLRGLAAALIGGMVSFPRAVARRDR